MTETWGKLMYAFSPTLCNTNDHWYTCHLMRSGEVQLKHDFSKYWYQVTDNRELKLSLRKYNDIVTITIPANQPTQWQSIAFHWQPVANVEKKRVLTVDHVTKTGHPRYLTRMATSKTHVYAIEQYRNVVCRSIADSATDADFQSADGIVDQHDSGYFLFDLTIRDNNELWLLYMTLLPDSGQSTVRMMQYGVAAGRQCHHTNTIDYMIGGYPIDAKMVCDCADTNKVHIVTAYVGDSVQHFWVDVSNGEQGHHILVVKSTINRVARIVSGHLPHQVLTDKLKQHTLFKSRKCCQWYLDREHTQSMPFFDMGECTDYDVIALHIANCNIHCLIHVPGRGYYYWSFPYPASANDCKEPEPTLFPIAMGLSTYTAERSVDGNKLVYTRDVVDGGASSLVKNKLADANDDVDGGAYSPDENKHSRLTTKAEHSSLIPKLERVSRSALKRSSSPARGRTTTFSPEIHLHSGPHVKNPRHSTQA